MSDTLEAPVEVESNQIADDNGTISVEISADDLPPTVDLTNPTAEPVRPEGLPEKFKTVEDMIKAYGELEAKQGSQIETPVPVPVDAARIKDPNATEPVAPIADTPSTEPTTDTPIVQKAIEDFTKLYVDQGGELTDANYNTIFC